MLQLLKMAIVLSVVGIVIFYVLSVFTDDTKSGLTNQLSRWLYLACFVATISSVLIYAMSVVVPEHYDRSLIIAGMVAISCLFFKDRIKIIKTNEVFIGQNALVQRRVDDKSMRLQFRGGINVLLHGERLLNSITDEVYSYEIALDNIECKSGAPMSARIAYQICPDFSNFQALVQLDEDESARIKKAKQIFNAGVINLVSIRFSASTQRTIKKDRKKLNEDICELVNNGSLRDQELQTGHKIKYLQVADTDDTPEVRKANEQLYVTKAQSDAVKKLVRSMKIDLTKLEPKERQELLDSLLASVMANMGKRSIKDVFVHIKGGAAVDKATTGRLAADAVESTRNN